MEDPGQTQPVGATVWQLGEGDSRALLHKSAPDIGWRRGKLVTNGQGQPVGASAKETPICQVYLDLILAPPHSHQQGSSSLVSMVTSVHSPVTMSFPVLRTPGQGISPLHNHPTSSTLDMADSSHQYHQLSHSCFRTRSFIHTISNPDRTALIFLLFTGSEKLSYFPKIPPATLQPMFV